MAGERIYNVTYIDPDDGVEYSVILPEIALPDVDDITYIEVCGRLGEGWAIVVDEDPEDGEKDPAPTPINLNVKQA